jgi:hypothetical protein
MNNLLDFIEECGVSSKNVIDIYESIRSLEHANGFTFNEQELRHIISSFERSRESSLNSIRLVSKV